MLHKPCDAVAVFSCTAHVLWNILAWHFSSDEGKVCTNSTKFFESTYYRNSCPFLWSSWVWCEVKLQNSSGIICASTHGVTLLGRSGDRSIKLSLYELSGTTLTPSNKHGRANTNLTIQQTKAHNTTIDKHIFRLQGALASFHLDISPSRGK